MKHACTFLIVLLLAGGSSLIADSAPGAELDDNPPEAVIEPKAEIAALSARQYDDAAEREQAIVRAALADLEAVKRSPSPMTGWTAQLLLKAGRKEEGLDIVRTYMGNRIREAKARMANVEKQKKEGTYKPFPLANGGEWGEPHVNGFGLWAMIHVYLRYQDQMDDQLKEDFKWLFTSNTSWFGSTGNLSFLIPLNLYLTENTWDPALLPTTTGRYGARGADALKMFEKRIDYTVKRGSPEFASRPYMLFNVGTLLSFDNAFTDKELSRRAVMAYEISIAHAAGTWLNGNWVTPNRIWAQVFGRGIIDPIDDFRVTNPPANPQLLKAIADRLVASGFDQKALILDIVASRTYQLSPSTNHTNRLDDRQFSHAAVRRLPAVVAHDAVAAITRVKTTFKGVPPGPAAAQLYEPGRMHDSYFLAAFGQSERLSVCAADDRTEPTFSQTLHMISGDSISEKMRRSTVITDLIARKESPAAIVRHLHIATLSRTPSPAETDRILAILPPVPARADYENLWWALFNSTEFIFQH